MYGLPNSQPYPRYGEKIYNQEYSSEDNVVIGDIDAQIKSCTTIAMLETYKLIVKSKPQFKATYDEVYAKLSNQTK